MKDGTPMKAMMKPWIRADARAEPDPEGEGQDPLERHVRSDPEDAREPVGHPQRIAHGDEPDERPDRQVDVARDDNQDHAGRDDRDAGCLDGHRDHVGRLDERPAAEDVERDEDHDEGDEHAEQPEVDLRLCEQPADRGAIGRLGLGLTRNRCYIGDVRHGGPPRSGR